MATIYVFRNKLVPGRYDIFVEATNLGGGKMDGRILPWRIARHAIDPEAYIAMARASFTDWCARNPELTG